MENPKLYPKSSSRAWEKTQIAHNVDEEIREDLAAISGGTRYLRRKRVSIRVSRTTEIEAE